VRQYNYTLTPGHYVGASADGSEDEPFEERFPRLKESLLEQVFQSKKLIDKIKEGLEEILADGS